MRDLGRVGTLWNIRLDTSVTWATSLLGDELKRRRVKRVDEIVLVLRAGAATRLGL